MFRRLFGNNEKSAYETDDGTLKSLRNMIDGYVGYNNVKVRKKTDEAIRKYWYEEVLKILNEYSKVQNKLMQGQMLSTWPASNSIIDMLNKLRTFLTTDAYRHSTFFETPDVSELLEIGVIYVLESETILELQDILESINELNEKLDSLELLEVEKDVMKIKSKVESVKTTITDRAELIASFELVGI